MWFTKPVDANCTCEKCSGKAVLWFKGDEIIRVTGRKDENGELEEFICNECRFEKKDIKYWNIEQPREIDRHSVISLNHYESPQPKEQVNLWNRFQEKKIEQRQIESDKEQN